MKGLRSTVITNKLSLLWPTNMIWEFCGIVLRYHAHTYIHTCVTTMEDEGTGRSGVSQQKISVQLLLLRFSPGPRWVAEAFESMCEHVSVMRLCVSQRSFQKNPAHCVLRKVERVNGNIHYRWLTMPDTLIYHSAERSLEIYIPAPPSLNPHR